MPRQVPSGRVFRSLPLVRSKKIRRLLLPPAVAGTSRPLHDFEIASALTYGNEEESDEEKDLAQPLSRASRMFVVESYDDEQVEEGTVDIALEWPYQLRPSPVTASTPEAAVSPALYKFCFDWRALSTSQIEPCLRREPFSQINCGPTESFTTPMRPETNAIHLRSRINRWQETTVNEVYTFLAIVLAMGLVVKSRSTGVPVMIFSVLLASPSI